MKNIVITGSTRGIGYGLAAAFLDQGCAVTVSGRTQSAVDEAVQQLGAKYGRQRLFGLPCDVGDYEQVQALWDAAKAHFGKIDIWINNAGLANPLAPFWEQPPERIRTIVTTNMIGEMNGSVVAIQGMLKQGSGAVYNMEGLGSDGKRKVKGLALYGSTKAGLSYFNESLAEDVEGTGIIVGSIRPGMVATDMLSSQYTGQPEEWEKAKRIFNIIADRVETVAPWIAGEVLNNTKNGARISWTKHQKIWLRFLMAPFVKRNVFG
jgi:NAD(P)-dependent dehydrogenase (short-subunit alcohol dehydrogenase family)